MFYENGVTLRGGAGAPSCDVHQKKGGGARDPELPWTKKKSAEKGIEKKPKTIQDLVRSPRRSDFGMVAERRFQKRRERRPRLWGIIRSAMGAGMTTASKEAAVSV